MNMKCHLKLYTLLMLSVSISVTSKKSDNIIYKNHNLIKTSQRQMCEEDSPLLLGPLMVLQVDDVPNLLPGSPEFEEWYGPNDDNGHTFVEKGGSCEPKDCRTRWPKVAIIIPYRDRAPQLKALLYHLHPILQRQQLDYRIFVVEQSPEEDFNR